MPNEIVPEPSVCKTCEALPSDVGKVKALAKLAKFAKTKYRIVKLKNGKKKRKKIREKIDSDWQTYYGSSNELTADIEALGKSCFKREILFYCYSKAECSYVEAREQFRHKVLESDEYYNGQIRVRVHQSQHVINESNQD